MKKYIRAMICISYTLIKFFIIKVFHFKNFHFTILNLISPFTEIEIGKKSKLDIKNMVKIRSGSKIRVRKNAEIKIGRNTFLNHGCIFTAYEKIIIGNGIQFGPNVLIYDHDHDYKKYNGLKNLNYKTSPIEIGDNTWVGANVIILRGTTIGKNCVVAAGTILNGGSYPDNTLIYQEKNMKTKNIIQNL